MTEILPIAEFVKPEKEPPSIEAQTAFFSEALDEARRNNEKVRTMGGPYVEDFLTLMRTVQKQVQDIDPTFTPEYTHTSIYQSDEVKERFSALPLSTKDKLASIDRARIENAQALAKNEIGPALTAQHIPDGLFSIPSHCHQGEVMPREIASRSCASACFRMVFGDIVDWKLSEKVVLEQLKAQLNNYAIDDHLLANIYKTSVFKEICQRNITSVEVLGADFKYLTSLATKVKSKHPKADVYCTVNLASNAGSPEAPAIPRVWHACVVLGKDSAGNVVYHDPSPSGKGAWTTESPANFAQRWAVTYNRSMITIAA